MGSKYPPSLRCCLPLWAVMLQVALTLLFCFFISYDTLRVDQKLLVTYQVIQDLTLMAALGFGFLSSSFRRHSWSSVAFNLFMLALGVQGSILLDHFLSWTSQKNALNLLSPGLSIRKATMSTMPVLISAGAVLGKANLVQLAVMVLMETAAFGATRFADKQVFQVEDHTIMMHGHMFGAYFGLLVAWCLSRSLARGVDEKVQTEKVQMATGSSLFAMLGTLLLWIFWPSFNSALVELTDKKNAVLNTYYALAVSTVTATSMSALSHPQGKINMVHIHNAVLAGGVAVGAPCSLIPSPWIAMVLGLTAGLISIGGAKCLPVCLNHMLQIQNPGGIHYTFGLPGVLGAVTYILLKTRKNSYSIFDVNQMIIDFGALSFALAMGMAAGLLTGWLLNIKVWRAPHATKYFDDQAFWEFPHLAVGF
ncbi:blood group Rh(D) polypeptide-like isoform X1 [Peromyscus eremicus]|uniref:blood group Rh(D) polypeptide-like isoform X1 n=1 Tax=Peromyscus eremicus TaxID=42410 RepID=UPI0027DB42A9|nr:blood group Rh(D) polypeptide-like isoform X1 [Peromyscus eremicus]